MGTNRPDIIELLELEKEFYAEQIRRVNIALAALRGETHTTEPTSTSVSTTTTQQSRKVKWKAEITKIYDTGVELDLEKLRNRLAENGFAEALSPRGKNAVYSTISRLTTDGALTKTGFGKYRKKIVRTRIIRAEEKRGLDNENTDDNLV